MWSIERDKKGRPTRLVGNARTYAFGDRIEQPFKVSRLEVIGPTGRQFSISNITLELHYQDDGKTLKVFYGVKEK